MTITIIIPIIENLFYFQLRYKPNTEDQQSNIIKINTIWPNLGLNMILT